MNQYLVELAKNDLANARDNLYRANAAAAGRDPNAQYGTSGKTLLQIIDGYRKWEAKALAALREAEK